MTVTDTGLDLVTGAFSYSGQAISGRLLARGRAVRTVTGHPERATQNPSIEAYSLDFGDRRRLVEAMQGVTVFYNTYWVRFSHRDVNHDRAVAQSVMLFEAARQAGVQRVVHVSITHPANESPYSYFRAKAQVEQALSDSGLPHVIVRPAILFGGNGVLLNNIAWLLRRLPVFAIGGDGRYRVRPVHVEDLAALCVEAAGREEDGAVIDAVGPERPTFRELVEWTRAAVGSGARLVNVPAPIIPVVARAIGLVLRDVLLTGDEYRAMADGLADTDGPATGKVPLSRWLAEHGEELGRRYANELDRHFRR
jgi:NADH dehydrogenase